MVKDARPDEDKLREVYLIALSREPTTDELANAQGYLARKTKDKTAADLDAAKHAAWEDLLWALINTKEFLFNH
jgi:hypothetical protein